MDRRTVGRHCTACDRAVLDLTRATETEVIGYAALFGEGGKICARVKRGDDGAAVLSPARVPSWFRRRNPDERGAFEGRGTSAIAVATALSGALATGCGAAPNGASTTTADAHGAVIDLGGPAATPTPSASIDRASIATTECPRRTPIQVAGNDRDGDGVADDVDKCPDQIGPATNDGCPPADRVQVVEMGDVEIIQRVEFASNSATVSGASMPIVQATAQVLIQNPKLQIKITGNADTTEPNPMPLGLSRANAVQAALVGLGVSASRITTTSAGSTLPLAPNNTPADRERNRRVDFQVQ